MSHCYLHGKILYTKKMSQCYLHGKILYTKKYHIVTYSKVPNSKDLLNYHFFFFGGGGGGRGCSEHGEVPFNYRVVDFCNNFSSYDNCKSLI